MCFSATASFATAATLLPVGAYCIARTRDAGAGWLAFASYPLAFGLQQLGEGFVWLGLGSGDGELVNTSALGFAFFSHFFWLFWVPFSVWLLETDRTRRKILLFLSVFGACYGISIFIPLFQEGWLRVEVMHHSIAYQATMIYDDYIDRLVIRLIYALQVVTAFMISSNHKVRIFGVLILLSVIMAFATYRYAFVSVWCFFAAILSIYMLYMVKDVKSRDACTVTV
jgi:hypothetical protein